MAKEMSESPKTGGELFIVDNSDEAWKGLKYVGNYIVVRHSTDPAEIAAHHKGSITPLNEITRVIFLQRVSTP